MLKLNNKGFLLVETLVVSVFVLSICVILYRNGMPIIQEYERRTNYDDIDSVYDISYIRDLMINEGKEDIKSIQSTLETENYMEFTCNNFTDNNVKAKCSKYVEGMNIEKIIISKYNMATLGNDASKSMEEIGSTKAKNYSTSLKTYIRYIRNQVLNGSANGYRIIIERKVNYQAPNSENVIELKYANINLPTITQ